jgi:hypothetical protein
MQKRRLTPRRRHIIAASYLQDSEGALTEVLQAFNCPEWASLSVRAWRVRAELRRIRESLERTTSQRSRRRLSWAA